MSTLPEITQALCVALAKGDMAYARSVAMQAAAKMGEPRSGRILRAFESYGPRQPTAADGPQMKHWTVVKEPRSPWVPASVAEAVDEWLTEIRFAEALVAKGERVLPLLLTGETRCGKTSSLCAVAAKLGLGVRRLSLADAVGSHLGESSKFMRDALSEAMDAPRGVWLMDELDAVAFKRLNANDSASQERNHAVGTLLTLIEELPPGIPLVATSNVSGLIDSAVLARMTVVEFPKWKSLSLDERSAFAASHGVLEAGSADSYAEVVKEARRVRVASIIEDAKTKPPETDLVIDGDEMPDETPAQRQEWLAKLRNERKEWQGDRKVAR